ncbi:hypothetical protein [Sinomonas gamaensis]|uniref:hypothetical protein n=1 Tax=Sinomonas gamaensis TaxID=2565624 RepID=UPI0011081188|nr:hypothetical protein [Sinomonas gamaensis]
MKSSGGAFVTPVYNAEGRAYLSLCDVHRDGRVFSDKEQARRCAEEHNEAHHEGRAPRFRWFNFRDVSGEQLA